MTLGFLLMSLYEQYPLYFSLVVSYFFSIFPLFGSIILIPLLFFKILINFSAIGPTINSNEDILLIINQSDMMKHLPLTLKGSSIYIKTDMHLYFVNLAFHLI